MKTKTLKEAIKQSVETFVDLDAHFSIFQITDDIRTAVNDDIYEIDGIDEEYVEVEPNDFKRTQPINHDDVKREFLSLMANNEFSLTRHFNGKFNEYYPTKTNIPRSKIVKAVNAVVNKRKNHTIMTFDKIESYLDGRDGKSATLKQIQSRFKGVPKTCQEILDMIEDEIKRFDLKCYEIEDGETLSKTVIKLV